MTGPVFRQTYKLSSELNSSYTMFSLGSSIYYIYEDNPPDYVDMGRSNEMRSYYAGVRVVKVVRVLPVHYPIICWVITESSGVRL